MSYSAEMRFEDGTAGLREEGFYGSEDSYLEDSYDDAPTYGADFTPDDADSPEYAEDCTGDDYDAEEEDYLLRDSDGFGNTYRPLPDVLQY